MPSPDDPAPALPLEAGCFEALGVSGVSLACGRDVLGIRLAVPSPTLGLFDDKDVLLTLEKPDAYAPDLSFVTYSWRVPLTTAAIREFTRRLRAGTNSCPVYHFAPGETALVTIAWRLRAPGQVEGRFTADRPVRAALFVNGCFAPAVVLAADATGCTLQQGEMVLAAAFCGATAVPFGIDNRQQAEQCLAGVDGVPTGRATALYPVDLAPDDPLHFALVLTAAAAQPPAPPALVPADIDAALAAGGKAYGTHRMRSRGRPVAHAAEAVAALAGYSRAYDPGRQRVQTAVNRSWAGPNSPGCVFGWDNFFTTYLAAWENPTLARQSLEHVVGTYAEHGIAGGPTQRNLIIPTMYARTLDLLQDDALAARTWPVMMDFMRFWFGDRGDGRPWRDGNGDGLIESGTCVDPRHASPGFLIQNAMDETGYDDFPVYSAGFTDVRRGFLADGVGFDAPSRTLTVSLVCQNSLYIAAARKLIPWANRLGHTADAAWLDAEATRVADRMRQRLFSADAGLFLDRHWDGTFTPVRAMTLFYPLLAGIADSATQERLRQILLDPKMFWGDNLIPTVSRSDPAYCDGLDGQGNYWRGNCWPPTTYIVYLAIKEAGWDDIAAEYARRVTRQFLRYWEKHGHAYENYPAYGAVDHDFIFPSGWGGREVRYTWAGMMPLCGLEEIFAPETTGAGWRFGNPHLAGPATWQGFRCGDHTVSATAGPRETCVSFGDQWRFASRPGVAVRRFVCADDTVSFQASSAEPAEIALDGPLFGGHWRVQVGASTVELTPAGGSLRLQLPAGGADVRLTRSAAAAT